MADGKIHSDYFGEDLSVNDYLARLKATTRQQTREEIAHDEREATRENLEVLREYWGQF